MVASIESLITIQAYFATSEALDVRSVYAIQLAYSDGTCELATKLSLSAQEFISKARQDGHGKMYAALQHIWSLLHGLVVSLKRLSLVKMGINISSIYQNNAIITYIPF